MMMLAALLAGGCEREEGIRTYNAPKDPPPAPVNSVASAPDAPIHWTAPPSWKPLPPGQMNYAAYQVSDNPPLRMTISQVTSMGSGAATLLANVNRWQGQLGLAPSSEENISKVAIPLPLEGREGMLIDLVGPNPAPDGRPQQRMLAAMVPDGDVVWTFKMSGPAELIAPQKGAFDAVVKSVQFGAAVNPQTASATPPPTPTPAPGDGQAFQIPGIASYTLPEGWRIDPRPRQMREATLIVPGTGNETGEIVVSRLSVNSLADLMPNLNRWRGQVHLTPTSDPGANRPQLLTFQQGPGVLRDFEGPATEGASRLRQFVAYTQFPSAQQTWFFRFVGPYDLVTKSKPAFEAFVKSVKFDDK